MRKIITTLLLAGMPSLVGPTFVWALGDQAPKTPLERAEQKINMVKAIGLYSYFGKISVPIPRILMDPIEFVAKGPEGIPIPVSVRIKKIGFRKMFLNTPTPEDRYGHPVILATNTYGEFHLATRIRVGYDRLNIDMDIDIMVEDVSIPVDIHALEDKTKIVINSFERKGEFKIGKVHIDIKALPGPVNRIISLAFAANGGMPVAEGIATMVFEVPDMPEPPAFEIGGTPVPYFPHPAFPGWSFKKN